MIVWGIGTEWRGGAAVLPLQGNPVYYVPQPRQLSYSYVIYYPNFY